MLIRPRQVVKAWKFQNESPINFLELKSVEKLVEGKAKKGKEDFSILWIQM